MLFNGVFAFFVCGGRCVSFVLYPGSKAKNLDFPSHILCIKYTVTVRHEYNKIFVCLVCRSMKFVFDLCGTGLDI